MKVIAVIEVPESYEGKWYIDGMIRYTEDKSMMKVYDKHLVELKPLPQKKEHSEDNPWNDNYEDEYEYQYREGYNAYRSEITGEIE